MTETTTPTTTPTSTGAQVRAAWDAIADDFDRYLTPRTMDLGRDIVSRLALGPGIRVLDVGAGSGAVAIPAARAGAEVVAVDIAPTMVERLRARARAEGLDDLHAQVGDGTALELDDGSVDVAVSLNGVSLFPDLAGGLAELVRVTRRGGEVAVATFGPLPEVEFVAFLLAAFRAVAPEAMPAPTGPLPPFRLSDPTTFQEALRAAGLHEVSVEPILWEIEVGTVDEFLGVAMHGNPIPRQLSAGFSEEQLGQVRQVLDGMLRERSGGRAGAVLTAHMQLGRGTA